MCPNCDERMIVVELDGIEVDHCPACHGVWFDTGELELLVERSGGDPVRLQALLDAAKPAQGARRPCPRCRRTLHAIELTVPATLTIDRCAVGDGVWLDAGELPVLAAAQGAGPAAEIARFFGSAFRFQLHADSSKETT